MRITLLNTYAPKLIATILKALREQLKENDQLNTVEEIAGPVPEIPLEHDQILKGGGRFRDDVNGGNLPEDFVLAARREEIDGVHSEGVYEIVQLDVQERQDGGAKRRVSGGSQGSVSSAGVFADKEDGSGAERVRRDTGARNPSYCG